MDMNDFKQKLKDGGYSGITSARKGIGRANGWTEEMRTEGHAIANKFFGETGGEKPAKKEKDLKVKKGLARPKRVAKAKAVKAEKAEKAPRAKAAKAEAVEEPRVKRKYTRRTPVEATAGVEGQPTAREHAPRVSYAHITEAIEIIKSDLNVLAISHTLGPQSATIAQVAERANQVLLRCAEEVNNILEKASGSKSSDKTDKVAENFAKAVAATSAGVPNVNSGSVQMPFVPPQIVPPQI